jgi:hypothetical protein
MFAVSASIFALIAGMVVVSRLGAQGNSGKDDPSPSLVQRGYQIAPVTLNVKGLNPARVGLGSYLVNAVGGCNDCHTCPSYSRTNNPYHGQPGAINAGSYLAGGVPFGPFTSRNLTPEAAEHNRPAGLTLNQFIQVFRFGTDFDQKHPQISPLLQVMPWPVYRNMTDSDISAIYEYLSAIPPAQTPPPGTCANAGE